MEQMEAGVENYDNAMVAVGIGGAVVGTGLTKIAPKSTSRTMKKVKSYTRKKVDKIEKAQVQLKADLPSPETILAVVYETGSKYRELDDVLSELEKRRRRILEDYQNLQSARAIDVQAAE